MTRQITFVVLNADDDTNQDIREGLAARGDVRLLAFSEDVDQLYIDITRLQPAAAIIPVRENSQRELALIKRMAVSCPGTAIITAARQPSPALILSSMRSEALEFLQLPIIPNDLATIFERVEEFCEARRSHPRGKVIAVFSSRGGSGTSFVATNLAAAMDAPTLLADLNLQSGDLDSYLGLSAKYSIADLARNRTRLDDALLASYVTNYSTDLSLLAAPPEADQADDIQPEHIFEVVNILRGRYPYVVLDLQHTFDPVSVAALDQADDVLLILSLDIPGIRSVKRVLRVFDRMGYPRKKIHIIVNRWSKQLDVDLKKVENLLSDHLVGFIPNDYRRVMDSINLGQPLVLTEPSSKVSAEIRRIATTLGAPEASQPSHPRRRLLGSLFKREAEVSLHLRASVDKA